MNTRPGIITQARTGSTRLPGKVFLKAGPYTLLDLHIDRLKRSGIEFVLAVPEGSDDDVFIPYCKKHELNCYRGSENDVLKRFYEAAVEFKLDPVIRVTSDCPFIDPVLIREALEEHIGKHDKDLYTSNVVKRTFPRGFDLEIFSFDLLRAAHEMATKKEDREHVTPWIRENAESQHHILNPDPADEFRLTVDTQEDLELITRLITEHNAQELEGPELIRLMRKHPELSRINQHIQQKEK